MKRQQFRFKKEHYNINDVTNISALVINSGHGYSFKTYCCKNCGEIFVIDDEYLFHKKVSINEVVLAKNCPNCTSSLSESLVDYPENLFYKGKLLINDNTIDWLSFDQTEMIEVYSLT